MCLCNLSPKTRLSPTGGQKWSVIVVFLFIYLYVCVCVCLFWALSFWWKKTLSVLIQDPVRLRQMCTSDYTNDSIMSISRGYWKRVRIFLVSGAAICLLWSLNTSSKRSYALFTLMKPLWMHSLNAEKCARLVNIKKGSKAIHLFWTSWAGSQNRSHL